MDAPTKNLFSTPSSVDACREAKRNLLGCSPESTHHEFLIKSVATIIGDIAEHPQIYDLQCQSNIEWIGDRFLRAIHELGTAVPKLESIEHIFAFAFRFLCERDFNADIDPLSPTYRIRHETYKKISDFSTDIQSQIIYAGYSMPSEIVKKLIRHPNTKSILDFSENSSKFAKAKEEASRELESYDLKVTNLKNTLGSYKDAFNFVGLHEGFRKLFEKKSRESNYAFWSMAAIAVVMIGILYFELGDLRQKAASKEFNATIALISAAPLVAIEMLLIYFFRIILGNYHSIKKQCLQLELRMALCQFIQNYAEYSKEIKTKDKSALEKFENLIFSGIVSDEQNLPSTFDGIEQLSKLADAIKGGKK